MLDRGNFMISPEAPDPNKRVEQPPDDFTLRRVRTLCMVGLIGGIGSLFIGGIYLGLAALICSIFALRQAILVAKKNQGAYALIATNLKRMAILAIVICVICLIANAVSVAILMPKVLEALESGDYTSLGLTIPTESITKTWG